MRDKIFLSLNDHFYYGTTSQTTRLSLEVETYNKESHTKRVLYLVSIKKKNENCHLYDFNNSLHVYT